MDKEKRIRWLLILIVVTLGAMCIFEVIFFEYHILPKQARVLDKMYGDQFIEVNRIWIDYYHGKINITDEQIFLVEQSLERMERGLDLNKPSQNWSNTIK